MIQKNNLKNYLFNEYNNDNISYASTNKDSNRQSSIKRNNYFNFFRNKNDLKNNYKYEEEKVKEKKINNNSIRIHSYINTKLFNENKYTNDNDTKIISGTQNNYYSKEYSYFNNDKNQKNFSLISKTMNILNLKKGNIKKDISQFNFNNYLSFRHNKKNKRKEFMKYEVNMKINKTQPIITNKSNHFNKKTENQKYDKKKSINRSVNNNYDFNKEKKKLELIKKQYIKNIKNTQILFHDIKHKMSNITEYQKNILHLNNKCLKHSALSQIDNLKKYKEENKTNLQEYKLKKNQMIKRPFSCNDYLSNKKISKSVRKKLLNSELINKKEKREKSVKNKINNIKKYNNINSKCCNSLRLFNKIYEKNKESKFNFYNHLNKTINNNKIYKRYYSQNISTNSKL